MKKSVLFLLLICSVGVFSQQKVTQLDKAKRLIKKELSETLNDFKSYEPVSFSKVERLYTDPYENENIIEVVKQLDSYRHNELKSFEESLSISLKDTVVTDTIINVYSRQAAKYANNPDYFELWHKVHMCQLTAESYKLSQLLLYKLLTIIKPEYIGQKVIHKYRAKNAYGAYLLKTTEFRFDKSVTKVIKTVDL